jgi:hypothetical protein
MSHLKITEPGWATYNGHLAGVEFKDGVSVEPISPSLSARIAGTMRCEMTDSGLNPSHTQQLVDALNASAPVADALERRAEDVVEALASDSPVEEPRVKHTKESLAAIADASGIKGLREIAEPLGLKAQSISELIEKIVQAQG